MVRGSGRTVRSRRTKVGRSSCAGLKEGASDTERDHASFSLPSDDSSRNVFVNSGREALLSGIEDWVDHLTRPEEERNNPERPAPGAQSNLIDLDQLPAVSLRGR